jgi:hypothetical protein
MTSGEKIGAALAKAVKSAAAEWKKGEQAPVMYGIGPAARLLQHPALCRLRAVDLSR